MRSSSFGKGGSSGRGKVATALLLVSAIIAYEILSYPVSAEQDDSYEPGFRAVIEVLERQEGGRLVTRARPFYSRKAMIRKSVSPSDFRLRFGKRNAADLEDQKIIHPALAQAMMLPRRREQLLNWQGTSTFQREE